MERKKEGRKEGKEGRKKGIYRTIENQNQKGENDSQNPKKTKPNNRRESRFTEPPLKKIGGIILISGRLLNGLKGGINEFEFAEFWI